MNILLIGSGGREHALAFKLAQSERASKIFVMPGNGGTNGAFGGKVSNVALIDHVKDFGNLQTFLQKNQVELVIVGPEQPLVDGIADKLRRCGVSCFGPSGKAAQLEGSKAFSKDFMKHHGIPTASYQTFKKHAEALAFVKSEFAKSNGVVIKASGLAAGKGVIIPETVGEAAQALASIMLEKSFGSAGDECVIEQLLVGEECSVLAFTDGHSIRLLPAAQDHKRAFDGDKGPNTGGMGAYAPAPIATPQLLQQIQLKIMQPTIDGMRKAGTPFVGILYAGIMVCADGPKVLEFNCRFGDPETQVLMPLLADDSDLVDIMLACCNGCLDSVKIDFKSGYAATVVAAAEGYPGTYKKGELIHIDQDQLSNSSAVVFHAGTSLNPNNQLVTSGGRVLAVTGLGDSLTDALKVAYEGLEAIKFQGMLFRRDIGWRASNRKRQKVNEKSNNTGGASYAEAGVSIDNGNMLVEKIKSITKATARPGSDAQIGGFGGLFDLKAAGYSDGETVLVSATDGVGTKLRIAHIMKKHDTIGIDLVAMNVNDLIVQGAEPLFFLDYFACGKLEVSVTRDVVAGIAEGCKRANCALVGGETAEMPGFYADGEYDLGGFTVGAVTRAQVIPSNDHPIIPGDILIGIASSGVHSNGYSLVRHLIAKHGLEYHNPCPFDESKSLGEALLEPTRIYVRSLLPIVRLMKVKALAHITGGGFIDNIPRVLPEGVGVVIDTKSWSLPPVFKWLKQLGNISSYELSRTFNCGIGMVLIVAKENVKFVMDELKKNGEKQVYKMGSVVKHESGELVRVENTEQTWDKQ